MADATTSVDPNWDPSGDWNGHLLQLLAETDWFLPNSTEARQITGVDDIHVAATALAENGCCLAVKLGAGGALAARGEEVFEIPAYQVPVEDTTGAGDSFDAGFIAAVLDGQPLRSALETAVVCGSLSTRARGGVEAQPTMEDVREALGSLHAAS
jgi:sugar/nucleoside kinase (ribokinase family)